MHSRKLSCKVAGVGSLVVLLHPVGLDGGFWLGLPRALSESGSVAVVDLAGHGASPDARRPGRMADYVDDVVTLLIDLDRGPATLLGVSFGGMISQNVALARPDLVAGLVLCACPATIPESARPTILQRGADAEAGGMAAIVESTLERWFTPDFLTSDHVARVRERLLADSVSNWAAAWEAISEHDALGRLAEIDVPALVIAGERDMATPLGAKRLLAERIPRSKLIVLPEAPHMMQIECPGPFVEAVTPFLDRNRSGRAP